MTPYEQQALGKIRAWQAEAPGWGSRLLAKPGSKVAEVVQVLVPAKVLRAALDGADRLGRKLSHERSILARAGVADLTALRAQPLESLDKLSRNVMRRALALGGATGAVFGVAGAAGLVADVPTLLTLAMRTIHRVGLCYGEKPPVDDERQLALGVFALVSANSLEEKTLAVGALRGGADLHEAAWRDGVERVTEREIAKNATVYSIQNLARSIGVNLGKRKAAGSIPVLGAAVGAAVNAWYLSDVAQAARYTFQERWLRERYPDEVSSRGA
ncbi:MAG: EcsC family protein [Gammaproteobacteria bacterium]